MKFTYGDLRAEAERELKMRLRVYPGRIATGRMREGECERKLALQQAIIEVLRKLEQAEQLF